MPALRSLELQVVVAFQPALYADVGERVVDIEALRFLTADGALLVEYSLEDSLDIEDRCTSDFQLGAGTALAGLQGQQLTAALHAAEQQPLRSAAGRWSEGLLLEAIHVAVTGFYPEI